MACVSNAIIIGGGIAGLSAAIALSKAGVRCDVVERTTYRTGASLGLSGRVGEALEELGVYDEAARTGRPFTPGSSATAQMDSAGNVLDEGNVRPPAWPGAKTPIGVYRPAFLEVLTEQATKLGATIRIGVSPTSIENQEDAVRVVFDDGSEGSYDLLIGADGLNSTTRAMLFPDAPKPAYSGQMSIRWMAPGDAIEGEGWYHSDLGRLGYYHLPVQNVIYTPIVIDRPQPIRPSQDELYGLLKEFLDAYTAPALVELRKRLTPESEFYCRPFEYLLLPEKWYSGRALLIGDAAHTTTAHMGQGGGMAIEDAVVLGQEITAADTLAEAFDAFMARRLARVSTVVETSVGASRLEQEDAPVEERMALLMGAFRTLAEPY